MSASDLTFSTVAGSTVYDPVTINGAAVTLQVTNYGDTDLTDLGLYIVPASDIGDVDFPADFPPETDYEDLLTWGTQATLGIITQGGIYVDLPTNTGSSVGYVTRSSGSLLGNKIPLKNLVVGETAQFTVRFDTPSGVAARRFFVDICVA